jgi:hypothetical protein
MYADENLGSFVQYKKAGADGLMGAMPANEQGEGPLRYSEKLSPAVNHFLAEASRQDVRVVPLSDNVIQHKSTEKKTTRRSCKKSKLI